MLWKELGHIICLAVHNHPAVLLGAVLGDLLSCQRHIEDCSRSTDAAGEEEKLAAELLRRYSNEHDAAASREELMGRPFGGVNELDRLCDGEFPDQRF